MAGDTAKAMGHIRKRQYQPSITSFFNRDASVQSEPGAHRTTASSLSPPLPAETQASLLSVGMRVRKSVPEGYKTHTTLGTDGLPFSSTAPVKGAVSPEKHTYSSQGTARELQPFCGLHKIGGWAQQEQDQIFAPRLSAPSAMQMHTYEDDVDDWGVPKLSASQSTLASSQASSASAGVLRVNNNSGNKKRTYEEETEEDLDDIFGDMYTEAAVRGPVYTDASMHLTRPIAKPKKPGRDKRLAASAVGVLVDEDFDEATFLQPQDGMDFAW